MNAAHWDAVKARAGPVGFVLSRTARSLSGRVATRDAVAGGAAAGGFGVGGVGQCCGGRDAGGGHVHSSLITVWIR
ncbi:MAG: hypothetical protein ACRDSI_11185, partial [Pseudonocardiaceae bacterium]